MDVFGGAPRFLAYPRPVVVQSGADAVLKCQIGGDPRPAVIWERNNEKIDLQGRYRVFEDGNVYNLIITVVTIEDSGQYICKAKNSIGETYAAATLKVEGEAQEMELREENKPRFLIKPLSTRVGRGDDAVFSCKLWGNPRPDVVWEKDGKKLNEIFESTHFSVGFQDGGWFQLKIFKTRAPDGGVYTCKARNDFGEALAGAVLLVDAGPGHEEEGNRNGYTNCHWKSHQGKPRGGRQMPNRLKEDTLTKSTKVKMFAVTEGKHAKFRCFVTGKPKPEIIWRKDGKLILSGRRYLLYEDREGYFTLKVLYCKQKDNGVYVCAASNTAGQTLSAVHLSVKEPPVRFKQPLIDLEVWERDLAVLECEVPEDSVPITWYLEDRRLQPGAKYGMEEWGTKRRLTIRDIGVDDDGIYLCEMPDGGRSIAEVAVKGTILRKLPRKVDVLEGENAAYCVEVEKEEMDIHWYKDGVELRETHQTIIKSFGRTHILVFVNTMPQDSGLVTFLVGRSKTSSQLRVKAARHCPPSCPVGVQINTERANAALLSWVPAQDSRRNPPSGYVLERQEVGTGSQEWLQCLTTDSATSVEILGDSVPCEADYRFRICSVNKYGKSNNVEFPRGVHLVPVARIQAPLQDALVPEGQDAHFSIELSASVIGTWFLNGTQLQEDERYSMRRTRTHQSLRIRGVRDTDNGAEITFIAYGIRDSAAMYIQAPLVKFSPLSEMDRNKFVEIGNPIVLYCELSDPAAPVHWYKNGVELQTMEGLHIQSEGTMRRIVIQSAEFSHSGVYCCDAIDDVIRFNVEVEAPPVRFSAIPDAERNKTVQQGCPIVLQCELSDPCAQVYWYKDGSKLLPQPGVDILTDGFARKLIIPTAEFFHTGLYCCKTKGDSVLFNVDVKAPPVKFSAIPEELRTKWIEAGCPLVLQCVVSDDDAHVCWYRDEMQLIPHSGLEITSEGNRRTLVVQCTEVCHSGVYRCTTQDDTMDFQVEIKDVVKTHSIEATSSAEPTTEASDPAFQLSWHRDQEHDSNKEADFELGGIKKTLVTAPTQPSNSGPYYSATTDAVTQLIKNEASSPTNLLDPDGEKTKSAKVQKAIVRQFEISDPIAKACWYKDGTQIYPKSKADCESQSSTQTLPIQALDLPPDGGFGCKTFGATQSNVAIKAEQFQYGDEIGEVADASAQYTMDDKATSPRLSSDQEKKSSEDPYPVDVDCNPSKCNYAISSGKSGDMACEEHSRQIPPESAFKYLTERIKTKEAKELFDNHRTINARSSVYSSAVKSTTMQNDIQHHKNQAPESQGEDFIYYVQHAEAPSEERDTSLETSAKTDEFRSFLQTATVESDEAIPRTLNAPSEVPHHSVQITTVGSDLDNTLQSSNAKVKHQTKSLQIPTCKSDKLCHPMKLPQLDELLESSHIENVQKEQLFASSQSVAFKSQENVKSSLVSPSQAVIVQSQENVTSSRETSSQPETVHSEEPLTSLQSLIVQPEKLVTSLQSIIVQSNKPSTSLQSLTAQSDEPVTFPKSVTARSDKLHTSSPAAAIQSKELFTSSHAVAVQSQELLTSPETETFHSNELYTSSPGTAVQSKNLFTSLENAGFQSQELFTSSDAAAVQSKDLHTSVQTATVQSNKKQELLTSVHKSTNQSEEPLKILKTTTTPSEELHSNIQMLNPMTVKTFDGFKTEKSEWPYISAWTPTDYQEELDRPLQTSTRQSEELDGLHHTASLKSLDLITLKTAPQVQQGNQEFATNDLLLTEQAASSHSDGLNQSMQSTAMPEMCCQPKSTVGKLADTGNSGQRASSIFAESCMKLASTVQSEAIYLSCGNQWNDSVTANKVAVEAPPVKITTLCEAEKKKSVEAGEPLMLRCEISDPNAQVTWYKDGVRLHEAAGHAILAEASARMLMFGSAVLSHAGIYCCKTRDDAVAFHVDVKASLVKSSALTETDQTKTVMAKSPVTLQSELSDTSQEASWYKDETELLPQAGVDLQSEGNVQRIDLQSEGNVQRIDLQSEGNVQRLDLQSEGHVQRLDIQSKGNVQRLDLQSEGNVQRLDLQSEGHVQRLDLQSEGHVQRLDLESEGHVQRLDLQSEGHVQRIVVPPTEQTHIGTYHCELKDDDIQFAAEVKAQPARFSYHQESDRNICVHEGSPIVLRCELSHDPSSHVDWTKDGIKLLPQNNMETNSEGLSRTLHIHSAEKIHAGVYECSTSGHTITFEVDVKGRSPQIMPIPPSEKYRMVAIGCPIILQCEVSDPAAQVSWFKDGGELYCKTGLDMKRDGSMRKLIIQSAKLSDSGIYGCSLTDDVVTFHVDVKATPVKFSALPEVVRNKFVEAGCPIQLQCEVSEPSAQVYWHKDGDQLPPQSEYEIQTKEKLRALLIKCAEVRHSGLYSCEAEDDHIEFKVDVAAPPVTFADIAEEDLFKTVVEQEELLLTCEVSRVDGVVQWYKDGAELQQGHNTTIQADGTKRNLTINSAQLSDMGTYTCRAGDNVIMFKVNIREPPVTIIHPREDVHLERHVPEEIILSCELSRPNGVVSWYKDGQKLQESENIKLKIEGPYRRLKILCSRAEDSGEYVCDTADDSIFFHLNITEPPVRILSPSQSQMELCQQTSERMVLSCEISRPNAVVRWYRNGLEVEENNNLILEVDGVYRRLIIPKTTVKDSAEYVCDTTDDSMTFFVNIAEPPVRFIRSRKMTSTIEKVAGETLVLDCEVSRSNAEVTWKRNGEEIEDSRNITILEDGVMRQLTVHSLTVDHSGQYVCDAKDDVMDFLVKIKELPVKILGKTDAKTEKQFLVSDDIILVCELSRSNASVRWYKDDQLIEDSEHYCSEEQGVFRSLVVLNAGIDDSGKYTCDAVDDKMVFFISVKEPPVQIIGNSGHPEHHTLVAGDDLILECEVSRPSATVQWLRNGKILKPGNRVTIDRCDVVRKLVLSGLQPSDSGTYVCDAIDDQLVTVVEVQAPPVKFVNKEASNEVSACESESVTLRAVVNWETANVRWLKDGQLLDKENIHISSEGKTHKLTINPLQLSDSGEYVCDVNTDEMHFSLSVKEMMMTFTRPLEDTASLKGSSLTLRCEINKLGGDVQWLKDGQEICPGRRHTIRAQGRERSITIHQLMEQDSGEYVCESTHDRTAATVTVEIPRVVEILAELRNITVCEGEDAVFKCVVSPEDARLVWRFNGKQVTAGGRVVISSNGLCHMLCIHNCTVSDSTRVTAEAEGLVSEAELQVQEQQVIFTKKMLPVTAEEYSEATLEVEVSLDTGEVQWMRQGVLIHPGAKCTLKHKGRKRSLTIHNLAVSDRGTYSCETLHDRTQTQLTVEPRKITIKRGLTDIKTTERETATFEVELSHPQVVGMWMRNGIQLKQTNHFRMSAKGKVHSLTVSNLSIEDTGTFMFCVERQKTSARLVVKEPPVTIVRKLQDQRVSDGAVISIECELSRHNVDVKWTKNGTEIKPSKDLRIYAMGRKRFLQILKCNVVDSGIYTCDAGDTTTSCNVEVYERELLITQGLNDLDIQEDQNAVFICELTVEDIPGEWYKNGERIQPTSTVKIRQEGTKHFLLMCNVRPEDSGEIKFIARRVESVAYLDVEELPVNIVKPLEDKTALEMSRVILDCTVSNPRCSIRWYKGCTVILPSERFEICSEGGYRKLIIQQVALDDAGTYSVQVGEYSCSAKLTVEAQPLSVVRELVDVEVTAPDEARFECEVSAPVVRTTEWSLNGERLKSSSCIRVEKMGAVHRLILKQTSTDMSGAIEFTCGKAKSRAQLQVLSGP
ncbi:obscurin isoform X8 [Takifugu rubripes]|uniref:obscurin isoform X8 n=1 Tax=Takifugu rubripes TaxID=31033 RepID=UPI0011452A98|nr:obscurin isoform X8 [Takifugu rubripes]